MLHSAPTGICFEDNFDYKFEDVLSLDLAESALECHRFCVGLDGCEYFTFNKVNRKCFLKGAGALANRVEDDRAVSGPKDCSGSSTRSSVESQALEEEGIQLFPFII